MKFESVPAAFLHLNEKETTREQKMIIVVMLWIRILLFIFITECALLFYAFSIRIKRHAA